jgi:undecaprenyl-diphosphatase
MGHAFLGVDTIDNLYFDVLLHVATVLSTLVVFRKDIFSLFKGLFEFRLNEETLFVAKLLLSSLPVLIIGLFFRDDVENLFTGNVVFVGSMLLATSILLAVTHFAKKGMGDITYGKAFIFGIAQAIAVIPGISRSGATIATGLLLKTNKNIVARFSFLMVILPILGAAFLEVISKKPETNVSISTIPLIVGFTAAFLSGLLACSWMIKIVRKGNLLYFAFYCFIIGLFAIFAG